MKINMINDLHASTHKLQQNPIGLNILYLPFIYIYTLLVERFLNISFFSRSLYGRVEPNNHGHFKGGPKGGQGWS
jgi:hypothetical protein